MCQCQTNPDGTMVVCDSCAVQMMSALRGLLAPEDHAQVEIPMLLTPVEHRGMMNVVRGWRDELEVATR